MRSHESEVDSIQLVGSQHPPYQYDCDLLDIGRTHATIEGALLLTTLTMTERPNHSLSTVEIQYRQWLNERYPHMSDSQLESLLRRDLQDSYLQAVLGLIEYTDEQIRRRYPTAPPMQWYKAAGTTKSKPSEDHG